MELFHHGIKGQKWGVRRYQKKDGTRTALGKRHRKGNDPQPYVVLDNDFVLKRGQELQRVTYNKDEPLDDRFKYVSYTDMDKEIYQNGWKKAESEYGQSYVKTYDAIKDMKVAGVLESVNTLLETYGDTPISKIDLDKKIDRSYSVMTDYLPFNAARQARWLAENKSGAGTKYYHETKNGDKEITKEEYDRMRQNDPAAAVYKQLLDDKYWDANEMKVSIRDKYFEKLSAKGYDAVIDIYDQSNSFSEMPVILLNPSKAVRESKTENNQYQVTDREQIYRKYGYY